jgi:Leucine rich repeat
LKNGLSNNIFCFVFFQHIIGNATNNNPLRKMSSSMSQNSLSSADGKGNKKDLTRQRAEARRLKLDAQIYDVDIGRMELSADGGIPVSIGSAVLEEDEGGTTTDGDSTTASNHFTNPSAYPLGNAGLGNAGVPRCGPRLASSMAAGQLENPPIVSVSTVPLKDDQAQSNPDHGDSQSIAESTVSSNDGISTVSGSGKSLFYGKGPISPANQPPRSGSSMDQSTRSAQDGLTSMDQSNRSTGIGAGVLFGKSSSLIFPTGVVDAGGGASATASAVTNTSAGVFSPSSTGQRSNAELKSHKINLLLDQCETVRFPFKKKLMLNSLDLTAADIPIKDLYRTNLGNSLHKLSLAGNRLSTIPPKLVVCLPVLKTLDLSQCELHHLPERWNLPLLKRLNLSHNRLTDFPEEVRMELRFSRF